MKPVDPVTQALVLFLLMAKMSFRKISYACDVSLATVSKIGQLGVRGLKKALAQEKGKHPGGRPRSLSSRERRKYVRAIAKVREVNTNFTVHQLALHSGLRGVASTRTFCRELHRNGYRWAPTRRKGVLLAEDLQRRIKFCKEMAKKPLSYWTSDISFYLDGVSFTHKYNPYLDAAAPQSKVWMRRDEKFTMTAKSKHGGSGGRSLHYMVGISHKKGIVICEPYTLLNAAWMKGFVERNFPQAFLLAQKSPLRLFLQDNDPSQQSASATSAWKKLNCAQVYIPPRSPDFNPIENIFNLTKKELADEAIEKKNFKESVPQFHKRITAALHRVAKDHADKTIESLPNRMAMAVAAKGARIRY